MAISFSCPQCGKGYKVKDELAGKTVPCKECAEPIRIPPAAPVPSIPEPELESLVKAALVEPAPTADSGPTEIEFECPNCIEKVKLDAKFAGKQAPCPSCKRIVRVPKLTDAQMRNWRATDYRPTLAKPEDDPNL